MMITENHSSARRFRPEQLWDAWAFAAMEAELALAVWNKAKHDLKAAAFAAYQGALDREEAAAAVLRRESRPLRDSRPDFAGHRNRRAVSASVAVDTSIGRACCSPEHS